MACTTVAAVAVSTNAFTAPARAQQVVVNGGFENGGVGVPNTAPPWVFNNVFINLAAAGAHSGNRSAIIGRRNFLGDADGSASQSVAINRGGVYNLTYYVAATAPGGATTTRYTLTSSIDGRTIRSDTFTPVQNVSYAQETALVRLRRGSPLLSFQSAASSVDGVLSYVSLDDVSLTFLRPLTRPIDFRNLNLTRNERAVADALYGATKSIGAQRGPLYTALSKVSAAAAPAVLDSLSGEGIAASQNIALRSAQLFTSAIFDQTTFYGGSGTAANAVTLTAPQAGFMALTTPDRTLAAANAGQPVRELADLPARQAAPIVAVAPVRTWRAWGSGFGGVENISGNARPIGSARQENSIVGGALGVDYQLLPNYLLGVALGGTDGRFDVRTRGTSGSTSGGHVAIYDLYELGNWYGASSSSFSYFGNQTTRFVNGFGGAGSEQNRGSFASNEFRSRLEIGRHFSALPAFAGLPAIAGFGTVTPFVAIELASLRSNGFTEYAMRGQGLFRLAVSGQSVGSAPGFVGLRFQRVTPFGGMVLSPTLQVAYVHEFAPYRTQVGTLANLPGSTFLVDGARPARDAAQVKAGAELALGPHSALFANFDGEFSGVNQLYAGKGGFRYVW